MIYTQLYSMYSYVLHTFILYHTLQYAVYIKHYHLVISHKVRATYSVVTLQGVNITVTDVRSTVVH